MVREYCASPVPSEMSHHICCPPSLFLLFPDISFAVNSMLDAHASFSRPAPLNLFTQFAPFGVTLARGAGNVIEVRAISGFWPANEYTAVFGGAAFGHLLDNNSTVVSINGVPALQFIRDYAASMTYSHRDPMTRLNAALGSAGTWARRSMDLMPAVYLASPDITYIIQKAGVNTSLTLKHGIATETGSGIADATTFKSTLFSESKKRNLGNSGPSVDGTFVQYKTGSACVLRFATFFVERTAILNYRQQLELAIKDCGDLGYKNLIVDVSSNLGGAPAAAQIAAALLVEPWEKISSIVDVNNYDHPFQLFDIPINTKWAALANNSGLNNTGTDGLWPARNYINPVTGAELLPGGFISGPSRTIGSISRVLSQPGLFFGFADLPGGNYTPMAAPKRFFEKIIIVSNGICGSSCGQFVNLLRTSDRVRTVYVGGLPGVDADPASYAGGARFDYATLLTQLPVLAAAQLPTIRMNQPILAFNGWESYKTCASYFRGDAPSDMFLGKADARVDHWDYVATPLTGKVGATAADKILADDLYNEILNFFPQMPVNLTRLTRPRFNGTALCATDDAFYPETFSSTCVGRWEATGPCNATCGGGYQPERYNLYITADNSCPFANGATRMAQCNTQACPCLQETRRSSLCRSTCSEDLVYKSLNGSGPCPNADGSGAGTRSCNRELCLPSGRSASLRGAVLPIVHCIELVNAVANPQIYAAYWGYANENSDSFTIAVGSGNKFTGLTPDAPNQNQITNFNPGFNPFQFGTQFPDGQIPAWNIDTRMEANGNVISSCPSSDGQSMQATILVETQYPLVSNTAQLRACIKADMKRTGDNVIVTDAFPASGSAGVWQISSFLHLVFPSITSA